MDDVRFGPDYVCLALNSGRSGGIAEGPFLTLSGHSMPREVAAAVRRWTRFNILC